MPEPVLKTTIKKSIIKNDYEEDEETEEVVASEFDKSVYGEKNQNLDKGRNGIRVHYTFTI